VARKKKITLSPRDDESLVMDVPYGFNSAHLEAFHGQTIYADMQKMRDDEWPEPPA